MKKYGNTYYGNYATDKGVKLLLEKENLCFYFIPIKKFFIFKFNSMKNDAYESKSAFSVFFKHLAKNFAALFESGNKKEFQRLKDFITS